MQRIEIVARLSEVTTRVARGELGRDGLAKELLRLLSDIGHSPGTQESLPGIRAPSKPSGPSIQKQAVEIFEHWQIVMDKPSSRFTGDRKVKVLRRLRDGFTPSQIKLAIDGCANSPFHMGENDNGRAYNDLEAIVRNGSNVEKFMELAGSQDDIDAAANGGAVSSFAGKRRLEAEAEKALKLGDFDKYETLAKKLEEYE